MLIPRQAAPVLRRSLSFCVSPAEILPSGTGDAAVQSAPGGGKKLKFHCDDGTKLLKHKGDGCTDPTTEAWPCKPNGTGVWDPGDEV